MRAQSKFDRVGPANKAYSESHENADTDVSEESIHHTLGRGRYQAAPGIVLADLEDQVAALGELTTALAEQVTNLNTVVSWLTENLAIGQCMLWASAFEPMHFIECAGQALSTTTYAELFAEIGYTHGGAGATFNLPATPLSISAANYYIIIRYETGVPTL